LLQRGPGKQRQTGQQAAAQGHRPVAGGAREGAPLAEQQQGQQRQRAQDEADTIVGVGADMVHADPLGDEGKAPDHRCQQ